MAMLRGSFLLVVMVTMHTANYGMAPVTAMMPGVDTMTNTLQGRT